MPKVNWMCPMKHRALLIICLLNLGLARTLDHSVMSAELNAGRHWSFQDLVHSGLPQVERSDRVRTPIDAFILDKLEANGLTLSPDTDRSRLARRAYHDLIGLPPSPEQMDAFLSDERPDAYERLLDQLLDSPHFGIRWGRHWLDIVGYTDTISFDDDFGPPGGFTKGKWLYRDYVVRAFNKDKPYDRFLREQLAGDEGVDWRNAPKYTPEIIEPLVATGFFRCCEDISQGDPRDFIIWSVLHDQVEQMGTSLLGLTLNCARCHSHKFEPIVQEDYYRMMSLIAPAFNTEKDKWKNPQQRALPDISAADLAELNRHNGEIDKKIGEHDAQIAAVRKPYEVKLREQKLATLPEPIRADTKTALDTPADQRNEIQKYLAEKFEALVKVKPEEIDATLAPDDKRAIDEQNQAIAKLNAKKRSHGWIMAVYDVVGAPPTTRLLDGGDYRTPKQEVVPGFLRVLSDDRSQEFLAHQPRPDTSGRRTALARWLTDPQSPACGLTARTMINRIWQHLLGKGLVPTSDNLGMSGSEPTHQELLDWLARDFVEYDWRIKRAIKQIMRSSVYRQASSIADSEPLIAASPRPNPKSVDPENHLLWRARLRRLEAEVIRDSILAVSGKLDGTMGGPPVPLEYHPDGSVTVATKGLPTPGAKWKRTLYLLNRRIYNVSFLSVFDRPIVTRGVCHREDSAVALQSLSMLNDELVKEHAGHFARRMKGLIPDSRKRQIERVFREALARKPAAAEITWSLELLDQQTKLYAAGKLAPDQASEKALAELCQTILNTSEFLYLE